jgi:hypothetical protein
VKQYQKPFVRTVIKENVFLRCQATPPNCDAFIDSCLPFNIADITMQDCQFTACVGTGAPAPTTDGFIVFDCGGAQEFTADFITVTPSGGSCGLGLAFLITVDISPELPDTCNGDLIEYNPTGSASFNCPAPE